MHHSHWSTNAGKVSLETDIHFLWNEEAIKTFQLIVHVSPSTWSHLQSHLPVPSPFQKINSSTTLSPTHHHLPTQPTPSPGAFTGNYRRCNTGGWGGGRTKENKVFLSIIFHTPSLTSIQGIQEPVLLRQKVTCTSSNLINCIWCPWCGLFCIGETKRGLGNCFAEHLHSVRQGFWGSQLPPTPPFRDP